MQSDENIIYSMMLPYGFPFNDYEIFQYSNATQSLDESKNISQLLFTGKLTLDTFNNLLNIIYSFFNKSRSKKMHEKNKTIDSLKDISNTLTSKYLNKKTCYKKKINKDSGLEINNLIIDEIKKSLMNHSNEILLDDVCIDHTNTKLTYYNNKCGEKELHCSNSNNYERKYFNNMMLPYSLVICLDSNIPIDVIEGSTLTYFTLNKNVSRAHIFKDACIPSRFLIYPHNVSHNMYSIKSKNYVLQLKLKFWIKERVNKLINITLDNCTCQLCNSTELRIVLMTQYLINIINVPNALIKIIVEYHTCEMNRNEYLDHNNYKERKDYINVLNVLTSFVHSLL